MSGGVYATRRRLSSILTAALRGPCEEQAMKVRASVKKVCVKCKVVRRKGVVRVICPANPRHKQRQG